MNSGGCEIVIKTYLYYNSYKSTPAPCIYYYYYKLRDIRQLFDARRFVKVTKSKMVDAQRMRTYYTLCTIVLPLKTSATLVNHPV